MLKQRVITALIMITLIGAGIIFLPELWFALMVAALVLVAGWEWAGLSGLDSAKARAGFTLVIALLLMLAGWHTQLRVDGLQLSRVRDVLGAGCLWWAVALLWVRSYPASAVIWKSVPMRLLMGCLTLVPAWLAFVYLRLQAQGIVLIFMLIVLVAAADVGAYFTGRAWGKAKLAPHVSPGKSWAGFWGGISCASLCAVIAWLALEQDRLGLLPMVVIALVTALASVLGDLLESMVKRQQGVKDSGRILPGHGGMMDRLDSMTAAAPVFALALLLVGG